MPLPHRFGCKQILLLRVVLEGLGSRAVAEAQATGRRNSGLELAHDPRRNARLSRAHLASLSVSSKVGRIMAEL